MKKILFILLCFVAYITPAFADVTINEMPVTGYSFNTTVESSSAYGTLSITLNHPDNEENVYYYVYFVNSQNDPKPNFDAASPESAQNGYANGKPIRVDANNKLYIAAEWFLVNGYEWAYVIKHVDYNTLEISASPINVPKPDLPLITNRYKLQLLSGGYNYMNLFVLFPYSATNGGVGEHKLVTKIGIVEDNEILRKIRDAKSDGYSSLLAYAKSHEGRTWTYDDTKNTNISLEGYTPINGRYYYVYTKFDDPNGLYRNTDGISLVMGKNNNLFSELDWSYLGDDATSLDTNNETPVDETPIDEPASSSQPTPSSSTTQNIIIDNPKTGTALITFAWLIGVAAISYAVIYMKKLLSN